MRESNFSFPAQNKASVCITSQLYDRRALDTNSPLPLLNSLTHLTYLTSTSPRIREILTCDGGLERLVRLLHDFCVSPPPPENPSAIYGLSPPTLSRHQPQPVLNPKVFDRHAAYRFSLAFQCVVNVGVRGSESIRSRVVQAGTLDVVGCILEAWLASKGFAIQPSPSASGMPRETREQREIRRRQQRLEAEEFARLTALSSLNRESNAVARRDEYTTDVTSQSTSDTETTTSTDNSANPTPSGSGTPTGHVTVPGRDRSGTVIGRPVWDPQPDQADNLRLLTRRRTIRPRATQAPQVSSEPTSRPETETEDDGDQDIDGDIEMSQDTDENVPPPNLHTRAVMQARPTRRAVGIVTDSPGPTDGTSESLEVDLDAHIIINTNGPEEGMGGVVDGIVALDQNVNDDLAMGAPPGAPGALEGTPRTRANTITITRDGRGREELTPRPVLATLPLTQNANRMALPAALRNVHLGADGANGANGDLTLPLGALLPNNQLNATNAAGEGRSRHHHHRHGHHLSDDVGPFKEEDVLLSLQLLAYLSKYPHVRQAFYKQRPSFHPMTVFLQQPQQQAAQDAFSNTGSNNNISGNKPTTTTEPTKKETSFFKSFTSRGKEKANTAANAGTASSTASQPQPPPQPPRMTNVFSLVERFTFRPNPAESTSPNPLPFLPQEIQYWAGVIMRNACRKDESRGGIRQCARMLCGKWESYPREFAKCRRCRKAKYCGKECQSKAWSEGHRFWCSAREEGDDVGEGPSTHHGHGHSHGHGHPPTGSRAQGAGARSQETSNTEDTSTGSSQTNQTTTTTTTTTTNTTTAPTLPAVTIHPRVQRPQRLETRLSYNFDLAALQQTHAQYLATAAQNEIPGGVTASFPPPMGWEAAAAANVRARAAESVAAGGPPVVPLALESMNPLGEGSSTTIAPPPFDYLNSNNVPSISNRWRTGTTSNPLSPTTTTTNPVPPQAVMETGLLPTMRDRGRDTNTTVNALGMENFSMAMDISQDTIPRIRDVLDVRRSLDDVIRAHTLTMAGTGEIGGGEDISMG